MSPSVFHDGPEYEEGARPSSRNPNRFATRKELPGCGSSFSFLLLHAPRERCQRDGKRAARTRKNGGAGAPYSEQQCTPAERQRAGFCHRSWPRILLSRQFSTPRPGPPAQTRDITLTCTAGAAALLALFRRAPRGAPSRAYMHFPGLAAVRGKEFLRPIVYLFDSFAKFVISAFHGTVV